MGYRGLVSLQLQPLLTLVMLLGGSLSDFTQLEPQQSCFSTYVVLPETCTQSWMSKSDGLGLYASLKLKRPRVKVLWRLVWPLLLL